MYDNYNTIMLIGRVAAAPETRNLESGSELASFRMGTTRAWKNQNGEKKEKTSWHTVIAWNKLAGIVKQLIDKGALVLIVGELEYNEWEPENGPKRRDARIKAETIKVLKYPDKKEGSSNGQTQRAKTEPKQTAEEGKEESRNPLDGPEMSFQDVRQERMDKQAKDAEETVDDLPF